MEEVSYWLEHNYLAVKVMFDQTQYSFSFFSLASGAGVAAVLATVVGRALADRCHCLLLVSLRWSEEHTGIA